MAEKREKNREFDACFPFFFIENEVLFAVKLFITTKRFVNTVFPFAFRWDFRQEVQYCRKERLRRAAGRIYQKITVFRLNTPIFPEGEAFAAGGLVSACVFSLRRLRR